MKSTPQQAAGSAGLTLAELLVVIGIIAMTAAITVPFYQTITMNLDLNAASRDMASDMRLAQQLAVTTQINHLVIFSLASNYYKVVNASTSAILKARTIKSPITMLSISGFSNNTVNFNSTGAATTTGTITLKNPKNRTSTIEVKPSGYVKIQ